MEAIVLAGGFGTRLRSVVSDVPKPMAPIGERPFLEILLAALANKGVTRAILALGFKSETIIAHFGKSFRGMEIDHVVEDEPLGTGGAVRLAMTRCRQNHVFVFNGDTFLDLEMSAVEQLWRDHSRAIIVGREVPDTARYGRLLVENGLVTGFSEKGLAGPGLINAGCYVLRSNQLDAWAVNQPFSLETDFLAHAVQREPVQVFQTEGLFIDIGIPEDFHRAQTLLAPY